MADLMCLFASILAEEMRESVQLLQCCKQYQTMLLLSFGFSWCLQSQGTLRSHSHSTERLLIVSQMPQILLTLFSSLNSLTFASTFFSSAHVCWAAGGIPTAPFSGSCSPYSERLPREVGAGVGAGVEMEVFNFLTFLGGSSLVSEDCS